MRKITDFSEMEIGKYYLNTSVSTTFAVIGYYIGCRGHDTPILKIVRCGYILKTMYAYSFIDHWRVFKSTQCFELTEEEVIEHILLETV